MNQMLLRIVVVISVWASTVFGAARLFGDVGARAGACRGRARVVAPGRVLAAPPAPVAGVERVG
jgi:hypothetical protein